MTAIHPQRSLRLRIRSASAMICLIALARNEAGSSSSCLLYTATHKDIEQVAYIWSRLSNEGASRNSLLVNLGGGMITDLGGFAGATFKRGLRTVNIPTTLMASVDAAVGGKTGINFNGLKNEVGSFYPPECVFIDCEFLRTLDRDNLLSGYAEMIKHALISSLDIYASVLLFDLDAKIDYAFLDVYKRQRLWEPSESQRLSGVAPDRDGT